MGNKQVINYIHGKTSPKTITPNSPDEKTKYLKKRFHKKDSLKGILIDNEVSSHLPSQTVLHIRKWSLTRITPRLAAC